MQRLLAAAMAQRANADAEAIQALGSPRCDQLVAALGDIDRAAPLLPTSPMRSASDAALADAYADVRRHGRHIADKNLSDLHRLRRKLKRLRYACESVRNTYEPTLVDGFLDALSALNKKLGAIQDTVVIRSMITNLIHQRDPAASPAAQAMIHKAKVASRHYRRHLPGAWKKFKKTRPFW